MRSYAPQPDKLFDSAERFEVVGRAVKGRTTVRGEARRGYEFHGLIGSNRATDLLPPRTARLMQPKDTEVPLAVGEDRGQVLRQGKRVHRLKQRSMADQRKQSPEGRVYVCRLYQAVSMRFASVSRTTCHLAATGSSRALPSMSFFAMLGH